MTLCLKLTALGLSTYQLKDPICSRALVSGVAFVMGEGAYIISRWILVLLYMHPSLVSLLHRVVFSFGTFVYAYVFPIGHMS